MEPHTRQHFIPQCYLSNFSFEGKKIWVYNKTRSKSYQTTIDQICYIKDFYSIKDNNLAKVSQGKISRLSIEKSFFADNIEPEFSVILKSFITSIDDYIENYSHKPLIIEEGMKSLLSLHITIQFLRMPEIRDYNINFNKSFTKAIQNLRSKIKNTSSEFVNLANELEDYAINMDASLYQCIFGYGDKDIVDSFAKRIFDNIWTVYISKDGSFHTSDFPILMEPHVPDVEQECLGLCQYGSEITYVISPKVLLKIWDKRYFNDKIKEGAYWADESFVRCEQIRQYLWSKEIVISSSNDFDLANFIVKKEGKEIYFHPNFDVLCNWT